MIVNYYKLMKDSIVSTNMPGKKAADFYADFKLSDDGREILACPGGIEPVSYSRPYKNGQLRVGFPSACCENCPHREQCPAHTGKRVSAFVLSLSTINRAKTQRIMSGDEGADIRSSDHKRSKDYSMDPDFSRSKIRF